MRLDLQRSLGKATVAIGTVLLVVATQTGLWIVLCFDRMDADEVAAMIFRQIVRLESLSVEFGINAATSVALIAVRLGVTVDAVCSGFPCQRPVLAHPVGVLVVLASPVVIVGQGDTLFFVTFVTIFERHISELFVRHLFRTGLLLECQQAINKQCADEKSFFHNNPPFLEVVVEGGPTRPVVF